MSPAHARTLRGLLRTQEVAAPGTLHQGQPHVSLVPFALIPGGTEMLARFPQSEPSFGLADRMLFRVVPESIRCVGGFAQATTISRETLAGDLSHG